MADLLLIGIFCDYIPVMPLIFFHFRNFKEDKQRAEKDAEDVEKWQSQSKVSTAQSFALSRQNNSSSVKR